LLRAPGSIKAAFTSPASLRITKTALTTAEALDLTLDDIVIIIQGLGRAQFCKSMTSLADPRIWQDVYHAEFSGLVLYVKFTTDSEGYLVISLKEK
jgi:motility quorum-sensing regulator/GCU-specific mRNA interferase toxin